MNTPVPGDDYTAEALEACEKALRTIIAKVGSWGSQLVLFGGLAPRYIVEAVPEEVEAHKGTTDLDVVIGIAIETDEDEAYTTLQKELRAAGFEPESGKSDRWRRTIDDIPVVIEFFCPVQPGGVSGRLKRNPGGSAGAELSARQMKGAEIAGIDCIRRTLRGNILDHGGVREVEVQVVNILPFLILKAFALEGRDKEKDAYDIVWTLAAFEDGPDSAASAASASPLAAHPYADEAIGLLEERFADPQAQGPSNYARFFIGGSEDEAGRAALRQFAYQTVRQFLRTWHRARTSAQSQGSRSAATPESDESNND